MDILNWFIALDHQKILNYTYLFLTLLILINAIFKNLNVISLFFPFLVVGVIDSITSHELVEYLQDKERIKYRWLQYIFFSIFNILTIVIVLKRRKWLNSLGFGYLYQLYIQEIGLVIISIARLCVQFISMRNWLIYYATGEYSMVVHGLYPLAQTILLGLTWVILIALTVQNVFGLLKKEKQGVINA